MLYWKVRPNYEAKVRHVHSMDSTDCRQFDNVGSGHTRIYDDMAITTLQDLNKLSQFEILRKLNSLELENERLRESKSNTLPYCPPIRPYYK